MHPLIAVVIIHLTAPIKISRRHCVSSASCIMAGRVWVGVTTYVNRCEMYYARIQRHKSVGFFFCFSLECSSKLNELYRFSCQLNMVPIFVIYFVYGFKPSNWHTNSMWLHCTQFLLMPLATHNRDPFSIVMAVYGYLFFFYRWNNNIHFEQSTASAQSFSRERSQSIFQYIGYISCHSKMIAVQWNLSIFNSLQWAAVIYYQLFSWKICDMCRCTMKIFN